MAITSVTLDSYFTIPGPLEHGDVIKWKHFPRYWPFVRGIHRPPVNSQLKGQWRGALMFSVICAWINASVNNCEAGDLRRYRAHYDVTVMTHFTKALRAHNSNLGNNSCCSQLKNDFSGLPNAKSLTPHPQLPTDPHPTHPLAQPGQNGRRYFQTHFPERKILYNNFDFSLKHH